jgi:hypothetical protein
VALTWFYALKQTVATLYALNWKKTATRSSTKIFRFSSFKPGFGLLPPGFLFALIP